ncbi:unnamed protein product [Zymoseptoria tritici ST99CH_1A5]|uniref:Uncharacterized protein n=1 Tax=Zymoseptoria tritici ST99CH_1A5 TaxID=1276529 RepID=A0A1Y6LJL6_ZYMTR|nr:unnamed protein product [Zymoseptoria tritici ST99CH_3D1]SMY24586.1 unnamed protein product [Zymoseptoria tritici ST99CH_1A5]
MSRVPKHHHGALDERESPRYARKEGCVHEDLEPDVTTLIALTERGGSKKFGKMQRLTEDRTSLQTVLEEDNKASTWFVLDAPVSVEGQSAALTTISVATKQKSGSIRCMRARRSSTGLLCARSMISAPLISTWHTLQHSLGGPHPRTARRHKLGKSLQPKTLLGAPFLTLAYRQLLKAQTSVENIKQHYLVWGLACITGVRPGSMTVCPGYGQGASLGLTGVTRDEDGAMRWKDFEFIQLNGIAGITVKVTFKYMKGHRDPYAQGSSCQPRRSHCSQREVDSRCCLMQLVCGRNAFSFCVYSYWLRLPTAEVFIVADMQKPSREFERGQESSGQCWTSSTAVNEIGKNATMPCKASTQSGELDVTKAMKEAALNTDLRRTAIDIGMLERVSMYSFRREAIIEMQRAMGTELARTLANHIPDSGTVLTYDTSLTRAKKQYSAEFLPELKAHKKAAVIGDRTLACDADAEVSRPAQAVDGVSLDENDEFDKAELDEGGVEKTGNDSRTAPTYCNQLDDQAVIMPDYDEGGADTIKKLIGFVQSNRLTEDEGQAAGLLQAFRLKTAHLETEYRSRDAQLLRAALNTAKLLRHVDEQLADKIVARGSPGLRSLKIDTVIEAVSTSSSYTRRRVRRSL